MLSRIQNRINQSCANHDKAFIRTVLRICREFHCLPDEILKKTKVPQYMIIVENINEMDMKKQNGAK